MAYDENSFLQGIAVGRAMKGVTVTSLDQLDHLGTPEMRIVPFSMIVLRADGVPNMQACSLSVAPLSWDLNGEIIAAAVTVPPALGIQSLGVSAELTLDSE